MKSALLKCPECSRGNMERTTTELVGKTHKETFPLTSEAIVCNKCGFKTIPTEAMGGFALRVADAYRERHKLLTSSEIKERRSDLRMTQQQFANYLGVGVASIKRWELGQVQDEAMNALMVLMTDLSAAEGNVSQLSARLGKPVWPSEQWSKRQRVWGGPDSAKNSNPEREKHSKNWPGTEFAA